MINLWNQTELAPLTTTLAKQLQNSSLPPTYSIPISCSVKDEDMEPTTSAPSRWPETPFTLIRNVFHPPSSSSTEYPPYDDKTILIARLMALTHNTIFRALNAIYTQSALIPPHDSQSVIDLLTFTKFTLFFLQNHHQCEENVFFPMLEAQASPPRPGMMQTDVSQHKEFEKALRELQVFVNERLENLTAWKAQRERFDALELRNKIEALAGPLGQHLNEEIPRLLEVGRLIGGNKMEVCYKALHDEAEGTTDPFEIGPLVLGSQDKSMRIDNQDIQFPVLPFSWAPYLVQLIVAKRYAGAWRFCPSTFHGEPRGTEWFALSSDVNPKKEGRLGGWSAILTTLLVAIVLVFFFSRVGGGAFFGLTGRWFSGLFTFAGEGLKGSLS